MLVVFELEVLGKDIEFRAPLGMTGRHLFRHQTRLKAIDFKVFIF